MNEQPPKKVVESQEQELSLDLDQLRNLVNLREVQSILSEILAKAGPAVVASDGSFTENIFGEEKVSSKGSSIERLDNIQYIERPEGTMSGGFVGAQPIIGVNFNAVRVTFNKYRKYCEDNGYPMQKVASAFKKQLRETIIHEAMHVASFAQMSVKYTASEDGAEAHVQTDSITGVNYSSIGKKTPLVPIEAGRMADWASPETEIKYKVESYEWLNEAITEKLARQVGEEYYKRTGDRLDPDMPWFNHYEAEVSALNLVLGYIAKQLETTPDKVWEATVHAYFRDPASYIRGINALFEALPALNQWHGTFGGSGYKASEQSTLLSELQGVLKTAGQLPENVKARLNLS